MNTEAHPFLPSPQVVLFQLRMGRGTKKKEEKKKGNVLFMLPLIRMTCLCVILITGKTWEAKLFVASRALYVSQWTESLYFCKLFHILTCLHNKPSFQK